MPIRRHGSTWEVRIQHQGQRISRSFTSRADAAEFERVTRNRIADSRIGRAPTYTLEEALHRWLTNEAQALKSYRNLKNKVRAILPFIQGKALGEVAEVATQISKAGHAAGLKPATINRRLAILRRVGRLAHRKWGWLENDEAGRISLLPGEEPRYVQATTEQAEKLLKVAQGPTKEAIRWAIGTGLRAGELLAVQPHHFRNGSLLVTKTKTGKPRSVPLAPFLRPEAFPYGLTPSDVERRFREARSEAGMPWLQFRDLRRTFGSWVVQKTKSLKAAQDLLGHTTMQITAKHYAHLLEGDLRKAVRQTFAGMGRGRSKRKKAA